MADRTEANAEITDDELIRLLQIGYVLEGIGEARSSRHDACTVADRATRRLLAEARTESRRHRGRLEGLLESLGAESASPQHIATLVESRYDRADLDSRDDVLRDQVCSELSAYRFYDSLLAVVEESGADLGIDRDEVVPVLERIRDEELEGIREILRAIESRKGGRSGIKLPIDV